MKRYIRSTTKKEEAGREAASKMYRSRYAYWDMASKPEYQELDRMLRDEVAAYKASHPEQAKNWYDYETESRIVPQPEDRFYPSKELLRKCREYGYKVERSRSKGVPHHLVFITYR